VIQGPGEHAVIPSGDGVVYPCEKLQQRPQQE
jgi:hypothetical protein